MPCDTPSIPASKSSNSTARDLLDLTLPTVTVSDSDPGVYTSDFTDGGSSHNDKTGSIKRDVRVFFSRMGKQYHDTNRDSIPFGDKNWFPFWRDIGDETAKEIEADLERRKLVNPELSEMSSRPSFDVHSGKFSIRTDLIYKHQEPDAIRMETFRPCTTVIVEAELGLVSKSPFSVKRSGC